MITTAALIVPDDRRCEENALPERAFAEPVMTFSAKRWAEMVQLAVRIAKRKLYKAADLHWIYDFDKIILTFFSNCVRIGMIGVPLNGD